MAGKRERERRTVEFGDSRKMTEVGGGGVWASKCYKVPPGTAVFRFTAEKTYKLNFIPYLVGKGNPEEGRVGRAWPRRRYFIHADIGPEAEKFCCPKLTFGAGNPNARCAVCEDSARARREGQKERAQALRDKTRDLWLVQDLDDMDKGVQLFETGHFKSFGELLKDKIDSMDDDDAVKDFWKPGKDGLVVRVRTKADKWNGNAFFKPTVIDFAPRKEAVSDDLMYDAPCLDDLLIHTSYQDLKKIYLQEEPDDTPDEPTPGQKKAAAAKPAAKAQVVDDDEPEEEAEAEEEEVEQEEEEGEEGEELAVGDTITWLDEKTKKVVTGVVQKIDERKNLVMAQVEGKKNLAVVSGDDIASVEKAGEEEAEEEEVEQEDEVAEEQEEETEAEETADLDADEEFSFGDDDQEAEAEEEEPPPPPAKKPAAKVGVKPTPAPAPKAGVKPAPKPARR